MISYKPFWDTLSKSTETTYSLIKKYHISSSTIDKLRKDKPLNTNSLDELCRIFNCQLSNIAEYISSNNTI
jgi:DNA-binding Xre family transcriptional regulator